VECQNERPTELRVLARAVTQTSEQFVADTRAMTKPVCGHGLRAPLLKTYLFHNLKFLKLKQNVVRLITTTLGRRHGTAMLAFSVFLLDLINL
jgi:hypothetical protein